MALSNNSEIEHELAQAQTDLEQKIDISGAPKILVAEDYLDNQIILSEIFKMFGISIDIASDGQEAVNLVNKNHYDLVYMDIQMPTLDGISATKLIREKFDCHQLPIIALSATSYQQDIENCMNAGMNSYLSKPIELNKLLTSIIQFWVPSSQTVTSETSSVLPNENSHYLQALSNNDKFDLDTTIFKYVDAKAHKRLINAFLSEYKPQCQQSNTLLSHWSIEDKKSFCHNMIGSAGNIGAMKLQQLALATEKSLDQNSNLDITPLYHELTLTVAYLDNL